MTIDLGSPKFLTIVFNAIYDSLDSPIPQPSKIQSDFFDNSKTVSTAPGLI